MKIAIDIKSGEVVEESKAQRNIIVGIDLGTTNSLLAYIKDGHPYTIKDRNNKNTLIPSVIYFDQDDRPVVGDTAKQYLVTKPERTIYSIKRLLGRSYTDVKTEQYHVGYEVVANQDTESLVKIKLGHKYFSPIELSALILKELKANAEAELGQTITSAVITVPAYFNDSQRQATRDAGKLAGLDVLRIINEPTAASLAYGMGLDRDQMLNIAVYDLGGGTFDISILQLTDGIFEVLSTHGDTHLGGDDFDQAIVAYWMEKLQLDEDDLDRNKPLSQSLRTEAEKAKKALSKDNIFTTTILDQNCSIDKATFNQLIDTHVARTIDSCIKALADAKLQVSEIDKVIMVGGSTRVPLVQERVASFFGQEPKNDLNPDEIVAQGAAIQADILAGNRKDLLLLDVTPLSLGIETVGGLMDTIIPRNSKVPTKAGRQYTTSIDGQKNLKVAVYQGERELVSSNRKLGEFILRDIPPMAAGMPKIEIIFTIDADGILTVQAKELRSNTETTVEIKSTYGISEEEMGQMLLDSIKNAEDDMKQRALQEAINEANNILLSSSKFVKQNKAILSEAEIAQLQSLTDQLQAQVAKGDKDQIQLAMDELNNFSTPLAHRALDHNINESLKGTTLD